MLITGEPTAYHVMSRTALDGFVLGDVENEYLLKLIKHLSSVYLVKVLGFCIMGNHFHLLVRMMPSDIYSDEEIKRRFMIYYGPNAKADMCEERIEFFRNKWGNLSEYMRDIKQRFSRFYNKRHNRRGFFWGDRFKSVIVEDGETLINCLAYIDLNPVRAGLCNKPEDYRWNSLGYHIQSGNKDDFLCLDFGISGYKETPNSIVLLEYKKFVYEKAGLNVREEAQSVFSSINLFLHRTRYFSDSAIIGTKDFVSSCYQRFKNYFSCRREKRPIPISGLSGIFSLKRLSE